MTEDKSREDTIQQLKDRIKKVEEDNRKWMRLAGMNRLTQLPNSLILYQLVLPKELHQGKRLACVLLCPDGVGRINQQYGRKVGDQLIQQIGHFLKQQKEPQEQLFHCDGANFALLIPDALEERARRRVTAIKNQFKEKTFSVEGQKFSELTCSAGIAETGDQVEKADIPKYVDRLYHELGNRLDKAKQGGGQRAKQR